MRPRNSGLPTAVEWRPRALRRRTVARADPAASGQRLATTRRFAVANIFYIIGVIVVVLVILSFLGLT